MMPETDFRMARFLGRRTRKPGMGNHQRPVEIPFQEPGMTPSVPWSRRVVDDIGRWEIYTDHCRALTGYPPKNRFKTFDKDGIIMRIILLGSGTGTPMMDRGSPALAVVIQGRLILFDIGPGSIRQLTRAGMGPEQIHQVFVSHCHPDHTADLIHLLFATRNPAVLPNRQPFALTGPCGFKDLLAKLQDAFHPWLTLPDTLLYVEELSETGRGERNYEGFKLSYRPTRHTPHSLCYGVEDQRGNRMVYSGDTGPCDEIVELATGADLLILESSFPDGMEMEGHLTPSQAGRIAASAGVNRLILTHFYPECLASDIAAQCRTVFRGELILGSDLLHVRV
jgi:ribonuclease BN (tRNA processing enzyme)